MAHSFRMTDDDTVGPEASFIKDILELSLLTAGPVTGPVDRPVREHGIDWL